MPIGFSEKYINIIFDSQIDSILKYKCQEIKLHYKIKFLVIDMHTDCIYFQVQSASRMVCTTPEIAEVIRESN